MIVKWGWQPDTITDSTPRVAEPEVLPPINSVVKAGVVQRALDRVLNSGLNTNKAATPALTHQVLEQLLSEPGVAERLGAKAAEDAQSETIRLLEEEGVTQRIVARRLREALDAQVTDTKLHQKSGKFVYSEPQTDNKTRLDAVRLAAEMTGMRESSSGNKTQVLIIDSFNTTGEA